MLEHASRLSRYVRGLLAADSDLVARAEFDRKWDARRMRDRLNALTTNHAQIGVALRVLRKEVMLTVIASDLAGVAILLKSSRARLRLRNSRSMLQTRAYIASSYSNMANRTAKRADLRSSCTWSAWGSSVAPSSTCRPTSI